MSLPLRYLFGRRASSDLDPRTRDIIQAAAMLEISEFDFMAIAFREWYGKEPACEQISAHFRPYMFGGVPPFWAHRLALEVLRLYDDGQLDRSRFGILPPPPATMREVATGIGQVLFLLAVLYIIFDTLMNYTGYVIR
ncbi:MAG: hypothetical protein WED00_04150 [Aquisalimonadaceae bacterium]